MISYFFSYRFIFVIVTVASVLVFISCKKSLHEDSDPTEVVTVSFKIVGVNSDNAISKLGTTSTLVNSEGIIGSSLLVPTTLSKNVSLSVEQDIENMESSFNNMGSHIVMNKAQLGAKGLSKIASVNPLPSTTKFRVVLINSNNDIVYNVQATSNDIVTFNLVTSQAYTWYAYTYGTEEDIPPPSANEELMTPMDKDFLYAKSTAPFTPQPGINPINIVFEHQVALVSIELDYDRLFAEIPTDASDSLSISNNFNWSFTNPPNFLYQGVFSLRTGQIVNHQTYTADLNTILKDHPTDRRVKIAELYTISPPSGTTASTSFSVTINNLNVRYPNMAIGTTQNLIGNTSSFVNVFNSLVTNPGKKYVAKFKLKYTFPSLEILHVKGSETTFNNYGYVAENTNTLRASYYLLQATNNFGMDANSFFRTNGFTHRTVTTAGTLASELHLSSGGATTPPDIVILGVGYSLTTNDVQALVAYLERGGVLFLMSGGVTSADNTLLSHQDFLRELFVNPSIEAFKSTHIGGSVYFLNSYDDLILNGPFGNIQAEHWGKHNGPATTSNASTIVLKNLPEDDVVEYSGSTPVNTNVENEEYIGATMIKYKKRHFFWVGDGGFIANPAADGAQNYDSRYPFATSAVAATRYSPVARLFGKATTDNSIFANSTQVYNSTIFANFMSWAIVNATFFGINHGGLGSGPYFEF